ncbi:MAG: hypothetical protein OXG53_10480 [Chloroflexi bacterium]|nr:hypothetical protein [Chloroflexota bacterium]
MDVDETTGADGGKASWTAVSGATAYILELQVGTTGSVAELKPGHHVTSVDLKVAPNATNCCKNGTSYRIRIKVTTSGGTSEWSAWDSFTFNRVDTFTGTPFTVSLSLSYDWDSGTLRITTSTSGGEGPLSTTECTVNGGPRLQCGTGTTAISRAAGSTYTVVAFGHREHERHTASATINVPASEESGDSGKSSGSRSSRSRRSGPTATPTRDPGRLPIPTQDHSNLPVGAEVNSDRPWIQFREVSGAGIGQQTVIDEGARQAIDLWGPLGVNTEVCFAGMGSMLLLDAAYSPRLRVPLESYLRSDGKTCAHVYRAGTVVLMPGAPTHIITPTATPLPQPTAMPTAQPTAMPTAQLMPTSVLDPHLIADSLDSLRTLENCRIDSKEVLNVRERPAGQVMGWYFGDTIPALARTPNWFKIDYRGLMGWISADYVFTRGDCD